MADQPVSQGDHNQPADHPRTQPVPTTSSLTNIFSDEFALEPFQVVDGFRPSPPTDSASTSNTTQSLSSAPVRHSSSSSISISPTSPPLAAHSTTSSSSSSDQKVPPRSSRFSVGRNSFSLRHDGPTGHVTRRPLNPTSVPFDPSRSISNASSSTGIRAQSPFQANGGPSFPYALYPQQNTIPEGPTTGRGLNASIPIGFPGHMGAYQPQFSTPGEDLGDIVGPDGHTEQLPPYTRYPNGVAPNRQGLAGISPVSPPDSARSGNPFESAADSRADVLEPGSRLSTRSLVSNSSRAQMTLIEPNSSHGSTNGASGGIKEKVKEKGKRRLCGLPLWAVILCVTLLVILGALIGGLTGAFVGHKSAAKDLEEENGPPIPTAVISSTPTVTVTKIFDATPLGAPPSDLPVIPIGTFNLPISQPHRSTSQCLHDPLQVNAWSCQSADWRHTQISVLPPLSPRGMPLINLTYTGNISAPLYGTQSPRFPSPIPLSLVLDTDLPGYGPAHFFQTSFDKQVLVSDEMLAFDRRRQRARFISPRNANAYANPSYSTTIRTSLPTATAGTAIPPPATPWLCIWNNTLLEGFIYARQNSVLALSDPQFYPRVVKLEERRNPDTVGSPPYCLKMRVLYDGRLTPVTDGATGAPVVLTLDESRVPWKSSRKMEKKRSVGERRAIADSGYCHCEWILPGASG
ncbi:MAG: hypothetical protein M1814_000670 [Vezdaea aestivalis]|nr:MAG: hypothetical protein M1814_000670 [Vezdaea aestivalis]